MLNLHIIIIHIIIQKQFLLTTDVISYLQQLVLNLYSKFLSLSGYVVDFLH